MLSVDVILSKEKLVKKVLSKVIHTYYQSRFHKEREASESHNSSKKQNITMLLIRTTDQVPIQE